MLKTYVELRVFRWDEETDPPAPLHGFGTTIDRTVLEFDNAANATRVFERARKPITEAEKDCVHLMADVRNPGPAPSKKR